MQKNTPATHRKPQKYLVGMAIHALRAYVKALELKANDGSEYSYHIPEDGASASVLDPQGQPCLTKPIDEWAAEGPQLRLAMIGLKAVKEKFEKAAQDAGSRINARFYLNTLEGSATLTIDGNTLNAADFNQMLTVLGLPEPVNTFVADLGAEDLSKVPAWARIGREVEIEFFQILQAAEKYDLADAAQKERDRGYRLGILRRPRSAAQPGKGTDDAAAA